MNIHQKTDEHPSENRWTSIRKQMNIHQKTNEHPSENTYKNFFWMFISYKWTSIRKYLQMNTHLQGGVGADECTCEKRPIYMWRETWEHEHTLQKKSSASDAATSAHTSKETYVHVKRDLYTCEERLRNMSTHFKRRVLLLMQQHQHTLQKIPMYMWKETYIHVKRDLGTWAHTGTSAPTSN